MEILTLNKRPSWTLERRWWSLESRDPSLRTTAVEDSLYYIYQKSAAFHPSSSNSVRALTLLNRIVQRFFSASEEETAS
ncbi:hypothetical protein TNCV_3203581 [Trichonephila clavipes]|nr:hypothetical protein TNCV_3203581 [Trichonephila clavipes]